jgi:hypothetical protein
MGAKSATQKKPENERDLVGAIEDFAKSMGVDLGDPASDEGEDLAKGMNDDEGDDPGEGDDPDDDDDDDLDKGMATEGYLDLVKSLQAEEGGAVNAVEFLTSFAEVNAEMIGGMQDTLAKSLEAQDNVNFFMAKSMKLLAEGLQNVMGTLNAIAGNPAGLQSFRQAATAGAGGILQKSFLGDGAGGSGDANLDRAKLKETKNKLEKAIGDGSVPLWVAATFDRTGEIPEQFHEVIGL